MWTPTRLNAGEGRCAAGEQPTGAPVAVHRGMGNGMQARCWSGPWEAWRGAGPRPATPRSGGGPARWRRGPQYRRSRVMPVEGRGLASGCWPRSQGRGDWHEPGDSGDDSAAPAQALREGEAGARIPVLPALRQGVPQRHPDPRLADCPREQGRARRGRGGLCGDRGRGAGGVACGVAGGAAGQALQAWSRAARDDSQAGRRRKTPGHSHR
jgi:hypothetical protein